MKYVFPLAVSVALCWLLFRDIDFSTMWAVIVGECRPQWILLGLGISILSHVFRAMRWRLQLRALGVEVSLWTLTLSIFGTYAVNLVFPRLGEVWRTDYVARRSGASFAEVFGSMVAKAAKPCQSLRSWALAATNAGWRRSTTNMVMPTATAATTPSHSQGEVSVATTAR